MATADRTADTARKASSASLWPGATRRLFRSRWAVFCALALVVIALCLYPWPGWGLTWTYWFCDAANRIIVPLAQAAMSPKLQLLFEPSALHPVDHGGEHSIWSVNVYALRLKTGSLRMLWLNETLTYVGLSTFLSLAVASRALARRNLRLVVVAGVPVLAALFVLNDVIRIVVLLDGWASPPLSPVARAALVIVQTSLNGFPGMSFAAPALLWWLLFQAGARRGDASDEKPESQNAPNRATT